MSLPFLVLDLVLSEINRLNFMQINVNVGDEAEVMLIDESMQNAEMRFVTIRACFGLLLRCASRLPMFGYFISVWFIPSPSPMLWLCVILSWNPGHQDQTTTTSHQEAGAGKTKTTPTEVVNPTPS